MYLYPRCMFYDVIVVEFIREVYGAFIINQYWRREALAYVHSCTHFEIHPYNV